MVKFPTGGAALLEHRRKQRQVGPQGYLPGVFRHTSMISVIHKRIGRLRLYSVLAAGWLVLMASAADVFAETGTTEPDEEISIEAPQGDQPDSAESEEVDPSITLKGSVWRTKAGIVFLKTPIGILSLSSKTTLKDLRGSQEVHFWVHDRHVVVEIRKRRDGSLVHRYLGGPLTPGPDSEKTLNLWTAEGEETLHFGTQEQKLSTYHDGDQLTVEVDDAHTIIGVHDLQFDIQISQIPPSGSKAHVLLSGTVSKLKSNFVFIRTPIGIVMVNAKIGVPKVKVGQYLTLHIDNGELSVKVGKASKPAA